MKRRAPAPPAAVRAGGVRPGPGAGMDEVSLDVTDADNGLRDRLNAEIIAFNEAATGYRDGRCCASLPATPAVNYAAGCTAGPGAAAATSICSGSRRPARVRTGRPAPGRGRAGGPPPRLRPGRAVHPLVPGPGLLRPPRLHGVRAHPRLPARPHPDPAGQAPHLTARRGAPQRARPDWSSWAETAVPAAVSAHRRRAPARLVACVTGVTGVPPGRVPGDRDHGIGVVPATPIP